MLKRASLSVAMILSACLAGQGVAAQDNLGSSWPSATDQSRSPNWHVYVFRRAGVKYIQVNDTAGRVREVVATSGGQFLVLPMGADSSRVDTPQDPAPLGVVKAATCTPPECVNVNPEANVVTHANTAQPQVVYQDESVSVTVAADSSGNLHWSNKTTQSTCLPPECGNVTQQ